MQPLPIYVTPSITQFQAMAPPPIMQPTVPSCHPTHHASFQDEYHNVHWLKYNPIGRQNHNVQILQEYMIKKIEKWKKSALLVVAMYPTVSCKDNANNVLAVQDCDLKRKHPNLSFGKSEWI